MPPPMTAASAQIFFSSRPWRGICQLFSQMEPIPASHGRRRLVRRPLFENSVGRPARSYAERALPSGAGGARVTMTGEEKASRLTRAPECLFRLGRFERTGMMTTARLLAKLKQG